VNRDTGNVLLVLVGGAILRISIGDTFLRYVRGGLQIPLLLAGSILVLLGLISLWRENPGRRAAPAGQDALADTSSGEQVAHGRAATDTLVPEPVAVGHAHDGHEHGNRVAWLLLLPVFAIFLIAPPALGSYAADRSTVSRVPPPASSYPPLPAGDPLTMRLDEYEARAVWDGGRNMADRTFKLIGFVSVRPGGGYYLTRMVISCCAADAVAVRISVTGAAGEFRADTWIEVVGHYDGLDRSREKEVGPVAVIRADSVQQIAAPREPYET
jgi:uncharacterized repeat protein (TIGR03943 family)